MPNLTTIVLMLIPLAIAGGLIWLYLRQVEGEKQGKGEKKIAYQGVAKKDWVATGRIDFATGEDAGAADQPAEFKLLVEERRVVESIAGNENLEIQWRLATLKEAKAVTAHYHQYLADHSLIKSVHDEQAAPAAAASASANGPASAPATSSDEASKPPTEPVVRVVASNNP